MAIVIVLSLALFMLILGVSYLKSISQVTHTNPHRLTQVQSDFFAQGIQKLAVLKFKAVPADFYHAYRYKVEDEKFPRNPLLPKFTTSPFSAFLGADKTILQGMEGMADPVPVIDYKTEYLVNSSKKFDRDMVEIRVKVDFEGFSQSYIANYDASRSLILPAAAP